MSKGTKQGKTRAEIWRRLKRLSSCTGKKRYKDGYVALKAFNAWIDKNPHIDHYSLAIYPCRWCEGWHIGALMVEQLTYGDHTLRENQIVDPKKFEQLVIFRRTKRGQLIDWTHEQF